MSTPAQYANREMRRLDAKAVEMLRDARQAVTDDRIGDARKRAHELFNNAPLLASSDSPIGGCLNMQYRDLYALLVLADNPAIDASVCMWCGDAPAAAGREAPILLRRLWRCCMTDEEIATEDQAMAVAIVSQANELARSFYLLMGYVVADGYRFDEARHPQERLCWNMACEAYEFIDGTSPNDALAEIED